MRSWLGTGIYPSDKFPTSQVCWSGPKCASECVCVCVQVAESDVWKSKACQLSCNFFFNHDAWMMLNVVYLCVLSQSYSDDILWFTIFYYSLDALLNTIWIVWTVFLSYLCSDSYLHVFVDCGLAFWGIIFSCSIWRSCSSLGEWSVSFFFLRTLKNCT